MAKISVAIPAHNEEESIQTNLKSIISSNFRGHTCEITICLSACKDKTKDKIIEFKKSHPKARIKVIEEKRIGKARAYKALDKYIKNNVIVFLDADCGTKNDSIWKIYTMLKKSLPNIQLVSGNAIDPRYTNKKIRPKSLIEAFNRVFWQHPPRRVINGQFFAIRKGVIQMVPDDIKLDDVYMSIKLWDNFIKDNTAKIIQGSAQNLYEIIRYQKNIVAGKRQIRDYLQNLDRFGEISKKHYSQFDIKIKDRNKYYPNISYVELFAIKSMVLIGKIWGELSQPTWNQTKGSKKIAIS